MGKNIKRPVPVPLTAVTGGLNSRSLIPTSIVTDKVSRKSGLKNKPIYTGAYHIFLHSIQRSKNLLEIHKIAHGRKAKPVKYLSDVHRAAIVLAISALDAYISKFVTNKISILLADTSTDLPSSLLNKIREATEKPKQTLIIDAVRKNNIRQAVEKILQEEYEKKVFQGTESIEDCMKIVGYENIFKTIASKAKLNEDDLKKDLNAFTKRRHIIVHRGDFDTTENPPKTENPITKTYATQCIRVIEIIAKEINALK